MTTVELECATLGALGWFVSFAWTGDGKPWLCRIECGVDVVPAQYPRPEARGETQAEALAAAKLLMAKLPRTKKASV